MHTAGKKLPNGDAILLDMITQMIHSACLNETKWHKNVLKIQWWWNEKSETHDEWKNELFIVNDLFGLFWTAPIFHSHLDRCQNLSCIRLAPERIHQRKQADENPDMKTNLISRLLRLFPVRNFFFLFQHISFGKNYTDLK